MKQIRKKAGIRKLFKEYESSVAKVDLVFMLQDWDDGYNVGGLFRVADACGATQILLTGKTPTPDSSPLVAVTSMGAHRKVPWIHVASHLEACEKAKAAGYSLVAVEVADECEPYNTFEYPAQTCLVLGNEGAGVYGSVMKKCSAAVFIPMAGKGRSLNVHVAGAIVAFEAMLGASSEEATSEPQRD
jgi:tRNA (guanosine-2'-O-)-methyltransferase